MSKKLKHEIMNTINKTLKENMNMARTVKGIEMEIPVEWHDILLKEGSIIRAYEKQGWKVRWYQKHSEGPDRGELLRSWFIFQSNEFAKQVR